MFLPLSFSSSQNEPIVFLAVVGYPGQEKPFQVFFFFFRSSLQGNFFNWLAYIWGI